MKHWWAIRSKIGHFKLELLFDITSWVVGVNFSIANIPSFYIHFGPLILGTYYYKEQIND